MKKCIIIWFVEVFLLAFGGIALAQEDKDIFITSTVKTKIPGIRHGIN